MLAPMRAERLRYRALWDALWSLRGPVEGERAPSLRGVRYRAGDGRGVAPRYDLYLPRSPTGASVLLVHGGGFVLGSRSMKPMRRIASVLSASGIAAASVDYRLLFRGGRLEEAVDDVRAALVHWRRASAEHGLDPERVAICGLSAGGTLTLLAAAAEDGAARRVVSCFGLYELDHLAGPLAGVLPRLVFGTPDRQRWAERSPRHAAQPSAPTLLLHGTADGLVPHGQAERLAAHRRSLGLPTELVLYPGAPHGFFNRSGEVADAAIAEIARHVG